MSRWFRDRLALLWAMWATGENLRDWEAPADAAAVNRAAAERVAAPYGSWTGGCEYCGGTFTVPRAANGSVDGRTLWVCATQHAMGAPEAHAAYLVRVGGAL